MKVQNTRQHIVQNPVEQMLKKEVSDMTWAKPFTAVYTEAGSSMK